MIFELKLKNVSVFDYKNRTRFKQIMSKKVNTKKEITPNIMQE